MIVFNHINNIININNDNTNMGPVGRVVSPSDPVAVRVGSNPGGATQMLRCISP